MVYDPRLGEFSYFFLARGSVTETNIVLYGGEMNRVGSVKRKKVFPSHDSGDSTSGPTVMHSKYVSALWWYVPLKCY